MIHILPSLHFRKYEFSFLVQDFSTIKSTASDSVIVNGKKYVVPKMGFSYVSCRWAILWMFELFHPTFKTREDNSTHDTWVLLLPHKTFQTLAWSTSSCGKWDLLGTQRIFGHPRARPLSLRLECFDIVMKQYKLLCWNNFPRLLGQYPRNDIQHHPRPESDWSCQCS